MQSTITFGDLIKTYSSSRTKLQLEAVKKTLIGKRVVVTSRIEDVLNDTLWLELPPTWFKASIYFPERLKNKLSGFDKYEEVDAVLCILDTWENSLLEEIQFELVSIDKIIKPQIVLEPPSTPVIQKPKDDFPYFITLFFSLIGIIIVASLIIWAITNWQIIVGIILVCFVLINILKN